MVNTLATPDFEGSHLRFDTVDLSSSVAGQVGDITSSAAHRKTCHSCGRQYSGAHLCGGKR